MPLLHHWVSLDPVLVTRSLFILAAAAVLTTNAVPTFRSRFLSYGSRSDGQESRPGSKAGTAADKPPKHGATAGRFLDHLAALQVPHNYFYHFYLLSVVACAFWAHQCLTSGVAMVRIASSASTHSPSSVSRAQTVLLWVLMSAQSIRRLYECIVFRTASTSRMWLGHYVAGLAFYAGMSVALWIEGSTALLAGPPHPILTMADAKRLLRMSNVAALYLFVQASAGQHQAHRHLYELRTAGDKARGAGPCYTLPTHPLFRTTLTPHYAAECLIYFALCVIGAPAGWLVNGTLFSALVFVVVNLGVTADGTRAWYAAKFGEDAIRGKARMIPKVW